MDKNLIGTTTWGQHRDGSNGNEEISRNGASPLRYCLVSYLGNPVLEGVLPLRRGYSECLLRPADVA